MKSSTSLMSRAWRLALLLVSLGLITYWLYFHNLSHLVPGYSNHELTAYQQASDWHRIAHNPLNAPYKLLVWLGIAIGHHSWLLTRIAAACFGVLMALFFYAIVYRWHGFRVAFFATIMFATSASFLHIARHGTPEILQMAILPFMGAVLWYRRLNQHRIGLGYLLAILLAVLLYIPGMVWLELFGIILLHRGMLRQLRSTRAVHIVIWTLLFLGILVPLALASVKAPGLLRNVAGLPGHFSSLSGFPRTVGNTLLSIGIHSPTNAEEFLGHLPLLNIIELALGVMGAYYYIRHERTARSLFLFGATILAITLIGLGGNVTVSLLIPLLYLFVASGLNNLISQWLSVFPRNPIAKLAGLGLVCLVVFFSVLYQTRAYFVAWPHNAATRRAFSHKQQ